MIFSEKDRIQMWIFNCRDYWTNLDLKQSEEMKGLQLTLSTELLINDGFLR